MRRGDLVAAERLRRLFLPLEDLRDRHSPIRVLHEAVRLCGVAETGPMSPFLSNITDPAVLAAIEREAAQLLKANETAPAQAT